MLCGYQAKNQTNEILARYLAKHPLNKLLIDHFLLFDHYGYFKMNSKIFLGQWFCQSNAVGHLNSSSLLAKFGLAQLVNLLIDTLLLGMKLTWFTLLLGLESPLFNKLTFE